MKQAFTRSMSVLLTISFLLFSGLGMAQALCNGPERNGTFNANSEWECAETCTDTLECSSYFFKLTSGEAGLCQLLDKFNDNFLSETITIPPGFIMKTALRWDDSYYYITPPNFDVAAAALAMGFDQPITIASLGVTRYLKKLTGGDLSHNHGKRRCIAEGGSMLQEYNQEVSEAVKAIYGPTKRYMGLHITRRHDESGYDLLWDNGQVDWGDTQSGSCPKYSTWTNAQLTQMQGRDRTGHITVDVDDGMKPGSGSNPPFLICQYYGPNIASGKVAGAPNIWAPLVPSNALDGEWFESMYHSSSSQSGHHFWYVDFGEEYAVKHLMWVGRYTSYLGWRLRNMEFYLSHNVPTAPLDPTKLTLCARFPYQSSDIDAVAGMTCNKWTVGRFFVFSNNHPNLEDLQLVEIAIRGIKVADLA